MPGVCDLCGNPLTHREDDREETVRERLRVYHKNNEDLLKYFQDQGLLRQVPALCANVSHSQNIATRQSFLNRQTQVGGSRKIV